MNLIRTAPKALIRAGETRELTRLSVRVKKLDTTKHIVFGEVYAPYIIDTHGEMMLPDDVTLLCHRFLMQGLNGSYDVMHNNELVECSAVESFIARPGDPDYIEGSWVLGTKVLDTDTTGLWDDVVSGKYAGYSVEMMVRKVPALAEIQVFPHIYGFTEKNDGHNHLFYATVSDAGKVTGGITSEEVGEDGEFHTHTITFATATDAFGGHSHRFFLP